MKNILPSSLAVAASLLMLATSNACAADAPLDIGSRRELFVDRYLIERFDNVRLKLHEPRDEGEVLRFNQPWEGIYCGYSTVIKDGERFRLYYRGKQELKGDGVDEVTCYAESHDGIHWTRPNLRLHLAGSTKENNIILTEPRVTHNFSPFLDTRPGVPAKERFKALGGTTYKNPGGGLIAFVSGDGIHWEKLRTKPVITKGAFDSQNVAFWSEAEQCYAAYFRAFTKGVSTATEWRLDGLRGVSRSTSKDFLNWTEPQPMQFDPPQTEHIYINQTHPYFRAPRLYIATAARFMQGRRGITDEDAARLQVDPRYFKAAKDVSDSVLLTSRDGRTYQQTFREALIRPSLRLNEWVSRCGYPALNVVQTGHAEMSLYVNQDAAQPTAHLRRYSLRLDGFASVNASFEGGEFVTKPLRFAGRQLMLNCATSAAGSIRVEIQDADGKPIPGFSAADCIEILGNRLEWPVRWKNGDDLGALAGQPVRLRFVMKDADVYALRFVP
ncbi:MAG: hypothetical protein WCV00_22375 [Verrucomicrobiia bacterium]|jgi:hypothetical protein